MEEVPASTNLRLNPEVRSRLQRYATRTRRTLIASAEMMLISGLDLAENPPGPGTYCHQCGHDPVAHQCAVMDCGCPGYQAAVVRQLAEN